MVCPPARMECSVTDDSSLYVLESHFSSALASGVLVPRSCAGAGACATAPPARPKVRKKTNTQRLHVFRIKDPSFGETKKTLSIASPALGLAVRGAPSPLALLAN